MTAQDVMPALSLLLMLVLMGLALRLAGKIQRARDARAALAARRLVVYAGHGRDYRMYVGLDAVDHRAGAEAAGIIFPRGAGESRWHAVASVNEDAVTLEDGARVPLDAVASFAVAYPSGRMIDAHGAVDPLPPGLHFPQLCEAVEEDWVYGDELAVGSGWLSVSFLHPGFPGPLAGRWRVRVANRGPEAVRVVSFGVYDAQGGGYRLATDTGAAYTGGEFLEWFGREGSPWLEPGETAEDPNGYGEEGQAWVFYFETRSGQDLVAGAAIPGPERSDEGPHPT